MNSVAQLIIRSRTGSAAHVTRALGLTPNRAFENGELPRPKAKRAAEGSGWTLESEENGGDGEGVEPADALRVLLNKVEPVSDALWQLESEGFIVYWRCVVETNDLEHDVHLDRVTLQRLLTLPGDLYLDVYDDGTLWGEVGEPAT